LSQINESATVPKSEIFSELNKAQNLAREKAARLPANSHMICLLLPPPQSQYYSCCPSGGPQIQCLPGRVHANNMPEAPDEEWLMGG